MDCRQGSRSGRRWAARREVTIQSAWDRATALHPFAVHFCSLKCKDSYMAELFAPDSAANERVIERTAPAEILVERSGPELPRVTTKSPKLKVHRTKRSVSTTADSSLS